MEKPAGDVTVPYFVHEGEMARMERINKKLWILCIVLFLAFAVTNAGWIYYEAQFTDELMEALQVLQPKLYAGVIRKIKGLAL